MTIGWNCTASRSIASATVKPGGKLTALALLRAAGLVGLFLLLCPIHLITKAGLGRSPWPSRFLAAAAWIVGARVRTKGKPVASHTLLISNHVTWLDILVIGGATGSAFVSKDALGHRFIHWLADQNETVYVRRADRKGSKDQANAIAKALERDKPIALFPEGTTGPGTHLLPFRSTLLEAASYAARDVAIRPIAIDYGAAATQICWWQESGKDNVLRLLGRRRILPVTVHLLDPLDRSGGRKQLTACASGAIAETLGLTSAEPSPIGG